MSTFQNEKEQKTKLVEIVHDAIQRDNVLREQYQIGDKFRFVRDRLQALHEQLKKQLEIMEMEEKKQAEKSGLVEDEVEVYIYLFNANGIVLQSWRSMLTPKLFYEYSVNRPAYLDKAHIETLIRSKTNKFQHAYLTIAIKKNDILASSEEKKDVNGSPVLKVREGSLNFQKLISLSHNDQVYVLNASSQLEKKLPKI